jgi:hypothetical protein
VEEGGGGRADFAAREQLGESKDSFARRSELAVAEKGGFQGWFSREGGKREGERERERETERERERETERERERETERERERGRDLLTEEWGAGGRGAGGGGGGRGVGGGGEGRNTWRFPVDRLRVEITRRCGIGEGALVPSREMAFVTGFGL